MPELPEVERVRLSLQPLIGRRVVDMTVRRAGVVERCEGETGGNQKSKRLRPSALPTALLRGLRIVELLRHGKQLAIIASAEPVKPTRLVVRVPKAWSLEGAMPEERASAGATLKSGALPCICVHLGMTGSLVHSARSDDAHAKHAHLIWRFDDGTQLVFDDPRRFGGVWTFASLDQLVRARWSQIGPDALTVAATDLYARLQQTTRGLKAALLDQSVIAGLGNIYVDELLFGCGLHPRCPARRLPLNIVHQLVDRMRTLLAAAIEAGGSSLRDYVDGTGQAGDFQNSHLVYGCGGEPCVRCGRPLTAALIAGRTTVYCRTCQPVKVSKARLGGPLREGIPIQSSS